MKVLIVKTSSLGDIIHTFPALTDASKAIPGIEFDWIVEENFSEIPAFHPAVKKIIPVALRRWRKKWWSNHTRKEWQQFRDDVRFTTYDFIIDAQGLLKSAWITRLAKGTRCGFDRQSARESMAAWFYHRSFSIAKNQHAILRLRKLFSAIFRYDLHDTMPDYGIDYRNLKTNTQEKYLVFLHGTTWSNKHWPEEHWIALAKIANENDFVVKIPWGNETEFLRAQRIAGQRNIVLEKLDLKSMAQILVNASGVVGVDSGLVHLATALNTPVVSLYGPTDPRRTGTLGDSQRVLFGNYPCAPCLKRECKYPLSSSTLHPPCLAGVTPQQVWDILFIT